MEKTSIPLIALAVFSIVILLANGNIEKVFAVSFTKVANTDETIIESFADNITNTLWVVTDGGAGNRWLYDFNLDNNVFRAKYNVSMNYVAGKSPQDIWCGRTDCFITYGNSLSLTSEDDGSGSIVRIASVAVSGLNKGDIKYPVYNHTYSLYEIEGRDSLTGGFGGINLWVDACNVVHANGSCRHTIILVDGIVMGLSATFPEFFSGNGGYATTDIAWNNVAGIGGLLAVAVTRVHDGTDFSGFIIYNTASFTVLCQKITTGLSPSIGASFLVWDVDNDFVYMGSGIAGSNAMHKINGSTCATTGTITNTITGLSSAVPMKDMKILTDRDIAVLQESGANARVSVMPYNTDTGALGTFTSIHDTFPTTSQGHRYNHMQIRHTFNFDGTTNQITNKIWIPYSGADQTHLFIEITADSSVVGGTGSTNGICNLGTALDCVGGNNAIGGLSALTAPMNATQIGNTLGQGVGIIDPNNDDVKTNGVGLLYMLMTGVFFAGALATTISKLNQKGWVNMSVKEIDPIFWLFLVIGVVSASWYIGWIPDIVFYGMMAGLAGLVTIGVLKHTGKI